MVGKAEDAGYHHFLLFPQCLLSFPKQILTFESVLFSRLQMLSVRPSKLKAFPDDNSNVAQMMQFFFDWEENIVGKGENAGNQHFLLFPQCF